MSNNLLRRPMFVQPPKPASKIGVPPGTGAAAATNRGVASSEAISISQGEMRSAYSTYFTKADGTTYVLYNGDRRWAIVTLTLETAGLVSVGDKSALGVVNSGGGILLQTGVPMRFTIGKGTKLYIASNSIDRVAVQVEPIPWLEMIAAFLEKISAK